MRRSLFFLLAFLLVFFSVGLAAGAAKSRIEIREVRHWASPESVRIVADVSGNFSYKMKQEELRISIGVPSAKIGCGSLRMREINAEPVHAVGLKYGKDGAAMLEIVLSRPAKFRSFQLPRVAGKPHRLVVDIATSLPPLKETVSPTAPSSPSPRNADVATAEGIPVSRQSTTIRAKPGEKKRFVVIVDAGHGGEDPGAIGRRGTQEKTLNLDLSKRIARMLNQNPRYRAYLTRDGDYYVSFRRRILLARQKNADLFVSIHVDASRNRRANGASAYALSLRGASSEAARILARQENLADMVGGVDETEKMEGSDAIVLSMFQTSTINHSLLLGRTMLTELGGITRIKHLSPQTAGFRVLMLPDVPSLLVETGFISNPREEALLLKASHRQRLAQAIVRGIVDFGQTP